MIYKIYIMLVTLCMILVHSEKQKSYGKFNLVLEKVEACKGPKKKDCTIFTTKISDKNEIIADFQVIENMSLTKGKVVTRSNGTEMMRLPLNKPCDNLFLKPLFQSLFNITNNCIIKKGHYTFVLDLEEIVRKYYGGMHLFGIWTFKSHFCGDQCNFSCTLIEVSINGVK